MKAFRATIIIMYALVTILDDRGLALRTVRAQREQTNEARPSW